jgi:hypothetical protein
MGKRERTLDAIFAEPTRANLRWADVEAMVEGYGAAVSEREGSRVAVELNGVVAVFLRPHPRPQASKIQVRAVRQFLTNAEVTPRRSTRATSGLFGSTRRRTSSTGR